jgi:hypothetical protein
LRVWRLSFRWRVATHVDAHAIEEEQSACRRRARVAESGGICTAHAQFERPLGERAGLQKHVVRRSTVGRRLDLSECLTDRFDALDRRWYPRHIFRLQHIDRSQERPKRPQLVEWTGDLCAIAIVDTLRL